MSLLEVRQKLNEIICSMNFGIDFLDEKHKSLIDDLDFDSLMVIDFIAEVENQFNIMFEIDDDLNMLINDIDLLVKFIFRRIKNNG